MAFRTKLDFSSNRQVKQHEKTTTVLSGGTEFGLVYSAMTNGPDLTTSAITQSFITITGTTSTFSGNNTTTNYNWFDSRMVLGESILSAITSATSATTQNTGDVYTANTTTIIDGNSVNLTYSGVSYDVIPVTVIDLGGGDYSGTVRTYRLDILSASTLDFTGRTIWNDVHGIIRTEKLIITNNPMSGYVWTCIDTEGMGEWQYNGSSSGSTIWTAGTGTSSAVLGGSGGYAGDWCVAAGLGVTASTNYSFAEGFFTLADGSRSHAEGSQTQALGGSSHAEGGYTIASGSTAHSEGSNTIAGGDRSHAEGFSTQALGVNSHAEGDTTIASGDTSHAGGYLTIAGGSYSHAEGNNTKAMSSGSHSEGTVTIASGNSSHAEGAYTLASGASAHAEGNSTVASGINSHAEGTNTTAFGIAAHAEGNVTLASGNHSHAEGDGTRALSVGSHAEGSGTTAVGTYAHVEGYGSMTNGSATHAEGYFSLATADGAHAEGGAFGIYTGGTASSNGAHAEGVMTLASNFATHAEGYQTIASGSNGAHAEGYGATASGGASHAEGTYTIASGDTAHAEGGQTIAGGSKSHAEGQSTKAYGDYSHAEGVGSIASGDTSHAQGHNTLASGNNSHAGGSGSTASGLHSFVHGNNSRASNTNTVVFGENITGTSENTVYVPNIIINTGGTTSMLGINTSNPNYIIDARGTGNRFYYDPSFGGGGGILNLSATTGLALMLVGTNNGVVNQNGSISIGMRGWDDGTYSAYGKQGDSHIYSSKQSNGLVLISSDGTGTEDYIECYVGGDVATGELAIHMHGTGATKGYVGFNTNLPTQRLDVNGNGRFRGIGSTASAGALHYTADGTLTTNTSDRRLKTNILQLTNALDKVKQLRGVTYNWNETPTGDTRIGFIAQEVNDIVPELTFVNPNSSENYMGVHYDNVTALLVEAVKELSSGVTISQNTYLETQTILAEDNNIELNYSGTPETAIGGGISVLHALGNDIAAELITDVDGNFITNNDFKAKALTIPTYTPTSSEDINGNIGNVTRDEDYLYIKGIDGWRRTNLERF